MYFIMKVHIIILFLFKTNINDGHKANKDLQRVIQFRTTQGKGEIKHGKGA